MDGLLFLPLRKCDPMSKTPEVVVFSARVPFTLFDTDTYASKYSRSFDLKPWFAKL